MSSTVDRILTHFDYIYGLKNGIFIISMIAIRKFVKLLVEAYASLMLVTHQIYTSNNVL